MKELQEDTGVTFKVLRSTKRERDTVVVVGENAFALDPVLTRLLRDDLSRRLDEIDAAELLEQNATEPLVKADGADAESLPPWTDAPETEDPLDALGNPHHEVMDKRHDDDMAETKGRLYEIEQRLTALEQRPD